MIIVYPDSQSKSRIDCESGIYDFNSNWLQWFWFEWLGFKWFKFMHLRPQGDRRSNKDRQTAWTAAQSGQQHKLNLT